MESETEEESVVFPYATNAQGIIEKTDNLMLAMSPQDRATLHGLPFEVSSTFDMVMKNPTHAIDPQRVFGLKSELRFLAQCASVPNVPIQHFHAWSLL